VASLEFPQTFQRPFLHSIIGLKARTKNPHRGGTKGVCGNNDNAVLIESENLSQFYHLDPVLLLITDNCLANRWSTILPDLHIPSKYDDADNDIAETIHIAAAAILLVTLMAVLCRICRIRRRRKMAKAMFTEETTRGLMLVPQHGGVDGTNGISHGRKNHHLHPYQDEPLQSPAGCAIV
jgi:hypothetical protein